MTRRAGTRVFWLLAALSITAASFIGCVGYEAGIEVSLTLQPSAEGALTDVILGDGSAMHLDGLSLTVDSAELVRCGSTGGHHHAASLPLLPSQLTNVLSPSRALAQHHHSSPLLLSGPFTVDFASPSLDVPGVFGAAPGCYDRVLLTLSELSLGAHHESAYLTASSTTAVTASAAIEPPLTLTGRSARNLTAHLARRDPFALLTSMSADVDGDRVLAGIAAQSSVTPLD